MTIFRIRELLDNKSRTTNVELRPGAPVSQDKPSGVTEIARLKRALKAEQDAHAETKQERDQFERDNQELKANQAVIDNLLECPECRKSFPNVLACWPGYLVPGEKRCTECYATDNKDLIK